MALPFLPEGEILTEFQRLQRQAESPTLAEFAEYVNSTWISNATWSPADWTVFKQAVRTNNDLEGWHVRPDQAATPGGPANSYPDTFGIREKTTKDPAPQIQRPAGKNLRSLGAI